ncbi:MAG: hypothetical protein KAH17_09290, partial [Bacteroidales bacterium]|nr:hypothetical protein [Bacteroidales bacterium]
MIRLKSIYDLLSAKKVFCLVLGLMFFLLVFLSLDAGISGDEPVHYQHSEYVNKYFSSGKTDLSALNTPETHLKYYGQVFDNISYSINSLLNTTSPYTVRHILNAFSGFLLILFSGLIAVSLGGYQAGLLTALLLFLSPKILGHSLNNLKDIPFAMGYVMAIWGLIKSMQLFPKIRLFPLLVIALGLGAAFGTRAGGLILIPIVLLFSFLNWLSKTKLKELVLLKTWLPGIKLLGALLLALVFGYIAGILFWPYALQDPIRNPFEALSVMTHYEVSIRQVFSGEWVWSEKLPWYYGIKWILISSPIIILAGFVLHSILIKYSAKRISWPILSLLYFSSLFPLLWTIINSSNLYGGWRHLIFIYPMICIISGLGWFWLSKRYHSVLWNIFLSSLFFIGMSGPAIHIIKNHPVEYVYFNKLAGGVTKANGRYETDYYFHGISKAINWLENYLDEGKSSDIVTVASNFPLKDYYYNESSPFGLSYINYYNRGKSDWDYGIFSSTYIDPAQLRNNNWPPENTIYEVCVDQVPVCVVIERKNKSDLEGLNMYRQSKFSQADSLFSL